MTTTVSYERIESEALSGLRGLAALHIVLFHNLLYSSLKLWISGSLEVQLFFLLSGYSLTLGYGRPTYDGHSKYWCKTTPSQEEGQQTRLFKSFDFFRNRFARIMPMYYLVNFALALPLYCLEHVDYPRPYLYYKLGGLPLYGILLLGIIDSIFPIGMILPALLWPFVYVGWTISTMGCFYLVFPLLLPKLQRFSSEKASNWIVYLFWIQLSAGIVFRVIGELKLIDNHISGWFFYWLSTGWGISRLPVFTMGILSALLRLRSNSEVDNRSFLVRYIYSFLPWNRGKHVNRLQDTLTESNSINKKQRGRLVDIISLTHIICCLVVTALLTAFVYPYLGGILNHAFQLICVHSLLSVIDGLTRDGGDSILSVICRTRLIQQLGRCSMTLYLIHEPLRKWSVVITKSTIPNDRTPLWMIPIVVVVSILVAWILTVWFEEPIKKRLRTPVNTTQSDMMPQRDNPSVTVAQPLEPVLR